MAGRPPNPETVKALSERIAVLEDAAARHDELLTTIAISLGHDREWLERITDDRQKK